MADLLLQIEHRDEVIHIAVIDRLEHGTTSGFRDRLRRLIDKSQLRLNWCSSSSAAPAPTRTGLVSD